MQRTILGLALLCSTSVAGANPTLEVTAGYEAAELNWNIAGDPSGCCPNILSELAWSNLRAWQIRGDLGYQVLGSVLVHGILGYGMIREGSNQDSDYWGDDRTFEFSRSNNSGDGDDMLDASVHVEYSFENQNPANGTVTRFIPMFGYSYHERNLRMTDGFQTIPAVGPFAGLDSTYQTQWQGPWLGLRLETAPNPENIFELGIEQHQADFSAQADWNLRTDFAHPVSFEHGADGHGRIVSVGYRYVITPHFDYVLRYRIENWRTDPGMDRVFFADGTTAETRLNEVIFRVRSLNFGINYTF